MAYGLAAERINDGAGTLYRGTSACFSYSVHLLMLHTPYTRARAASVSSRPVVIHNMHKPCRVISAPGIYRVLPLCHRLHSTHTRVLHRCFVDPTIHMSLASFYHRLTPGGETPNRCTIRGDYIQIDIPSPHNIKPKIFSLQYQSLQ